MLLNKSRFIDFLVDPTCLPLTNCVFVLAVADSIVRPFICFLRLVGVTSRSRKSNMESNSTTDIVILSGNSHPELAELIAK